MTKEDKKALCIGYIGAAVGLVAVYAAQLPLVAAVLVVAIAGGAPVVYMLNR